MKDIVIRHQSILLISTSLNRLMRFGNVVICSFVYCIVVPFAWHIPHQTRASDTPIPQNHQKTAMELLTKHKTAVEAI